MFDGCGGRERATPDIIIPIFRALLVAVESGGSDRVRVTVRMTVNWSAIPAARSGFEVEIPLWDLQEARRRVGTCIGGERKLMPQSERSACLMSNIETCRKKFEELFAGLV